MRNPKDVFTSSFHYYGMASYMVNPGTADEFMEKFLNGKSKASFPSHIKLASTGHGLSNVVSRPQRSKCKV